MPRFFRIKTSCAIVFIAFAFNPAAALADDTDDLTKMLHNFLDNVNEASTHDRFWAHDLIYTSSRGTRTTKEQIMRGFEDAHDASPGGGPAYAAEDVQIQVYGDAAIVAFRMVATPGEGSAEQEYLNTGTFLRRDGEWRVVAWQATIIPGTIIPAQ
ncbi:MAG: nuclear transport factor 2 family protein [Woeseiaceae bacterium]